MSEWVKPRLWPNSWVHTHVFQPTPLAMVQLPGWETSPAYEQADVAEMSIMR